MCNLFRILFSLFFLSSFGLTVTGQESVEFLNLCDDVSQPSSHSSLPLAVSVTAENLYSVSANILSAETWLRHHVLAHFPAAKITTIVVETASFCQQNQHQHPNLSVVLSSLKNVYHSLIRWGLDKDIKVSVAFRLDCLSLNSVPYNGDFKMVKPVIEFLQSVNSTYSVIPHPHLDKGLSFVTSQMKKLGFLYLNKINVVTIGPKDGKGIARRKLSFVDSGPIGPFPVRPAPMPETAAPESSLDPLPPLAQVVSSPPPMSSSTFAPQEPPPFVVPASSPHAPHTLPPCNPVYSGAPHPQIIPIQKLWCVAKPSVPEETLQQALDYACGEGGADCMEIMPQGNCYNPDTVVAHASYAFNSYWQKHKRSGGTCNFGGTAMLVNSDPSFLHCRFILS